MIMKKLMTIFLLCAGVTRMSAFCGFYVAKADASLFNNSSQVILARNGERSTITMWSDFKGDVKDFAMVVPVPVVLKKSDIKVVEATLFSMLDSYSGPRMAEYYDNNPCQNYNMESMEDRAYPSSVASGADMEMASKKGIREVVKIEARYSVGEYDILILSSKESAGLADWLTENGYKIPSGANEVLEPYIKSNMKFFVVKVNTDELKKRGTSAIRPIQISFNSPKFMLPIRLGMANANGKQDMIVYALSKTGRVETTNYRTLKMPTDNLVPEFVADVFGKFYHDLYRKNMKREGGNNVYLEYAWDVSMNAYIKCDPCSGTPPEIAEMMTAGVDWLDFDYHYNTYNGTVFLTRLHVTYDRENFPQDLMFQETPNKENYQARYVITHPAQGPFDCSEGKNYLSSVYKRRVEELQELSRLTGWDVSNYTDYAYTINGFKIPMESKSTSKENTKNDTSGFISTPNNQIGIPNNETVTSENPTKEAVFNPIYLDDDNKGDNNNNGDSKGADTYYIVALGAMLLLLLMLVSNRRKRESV